jgi:hypothetical protein
MLAESRTKRGCGAGLIQPFQDSAAIGPLADIAIRLSTGDVVQASAVRTPQSDSVRHWMIPRRPESGDGGNMSQTNISGKRKNQ